MRFLSLAATFRTGLVMATCGFVGMVWPSQDSDSYYVPDVPKPAFEGSWRKRPLLLIDEAHTNTHTAKGRFLPLARLARYDGWNVGPNLRVFSRNSLASARVLIIGNALGWRGAGRRLTDYLGLENWLSWGPDAFSASEVREVAEWVRAGGGLLLAAGPAPFGESAARLAAAFGVGMTNGHAEDDSESEVSGMPAFVVFARNRGAVLEHPITEGRTPRERVHRVVSFHGQALQAPAAASVFLRFASSARWYPRRNATPQEARSAAGLAQGIALQAGKGRVVILGETAMITAQRASGPGGDFLVGMNRGNNDNRQLTLNILHWLAGVL